MTDAASKSDESRQPPDGFSVRHADAPFEGGLRGFFEYRDLGIKDATNGGVGAHVIRARPGGHANPVWHTHDLAFQMVYVTRGWVVFEYEGVGEVRLEPGSCVHQPPGIRHREVAHSDDLEMLEITLPAEFETAEV
jgi:mannose-6-phosphate isomerase-like protein (cupin superfamily)